MKLSVLHTFLFIESPKIHTDLLWDLTLLFLGLAALYFIAIFFFRNRATFLFRKRKTKRAELAPIISNFLFHSSSDPKEEQKEYVELKISIREYLSDKRFRKILANILFDLQKDVAGTTRIRLFRLFVQLGLHHDSYKKLSSWRWDVVAQGILELAQMEVSHAFQHIAKYVNDKRSVVRKQAELAVVHLKEDGIDYLLNNTQYSISEWQQLKLIEVLETIPNYQAPKFKTWLISENKDVVLFSLRLIKYYNQNDASDSIIELVKHKDDDIKIAAISCIRDFHFIQAVGVLQAVFPQCGNIVKVHLLDALGELGSIGELAFLRQIAATESIFSIANRANRAINTIQPDAILPTKDLLDETEMASHNKPLLDGEALLDVPPNVQNPVSDLLEEIEIEEIEIYDLVEVSPQTPEDLAGISVVSEEIDGGDSLEIQEVGEELEVSLKQSLGLVSPLQSEDETEIALETSFLGMSQGEREQLLDDITENPLEEETSLLEFMVENEGDPELRFKAFNTLKKQLSPEKRESKQENATPEVIEVEQEDFMEMATHSIFYSLFERASDLNSKKILINETVAIGDEKEIAFLKNILHTSKGQLHKCAKKALQKLQTQFGAEQDMVQNHEERILEEAIAKIQLPKIDGIVTRMEHGDDSASLEAKTVPDTKEENEDNRIPLELCFLYDELGILYEGEKEKEDLGLNFELSEEYKYNLNQENNNVR